jgi:hypothetical protein
MFLLPLGSSDVRPFRPLPHLRPNRPAEHVPGQRPGPASQRADDLAGSRGVDENVVSLRISCGRRRGDSRHLECAASGALHGPV